MWHLFNKAEVSETLEARMKILESKVIRLDSEVLELMTAIDIIRNKVLRKIQFRKEEEEEGKDLNTTQLRGHGRHLLGGQGKKKE